MAEVVKTKRVMLAVGVLFAVYFPVAWWLKISYVPPVGAGADTIHLVRTFQKFSGLAFTSPAYKFRSLGDTPDSPERSPLMIYEDGKPLGPAHSEHAEISRLGNGRYSHWRDAGVIFSTSDNSDPNTNGREYRVVLPKDKQ